MKHLVESVEHACSESAEQREVLLKQEMEAVRLAFQPVKLAKPVKP